MEKKLSKHDDEMIIIVRKYLDDCLYYDYYEDSKKDIREAMKWVKELRTRLAE